MKFTNYKERSAQIAAFLEKYIPDVAAMETQMKKYEKFFKTADGKQKALEKKNADLSAALEKSEQQSTLKKLQEARLLNDYERVKPQEEWFRVENTHEAIISREVFEQVQTQIASRRRQQKDATTQIFAGLVRCADCGWSMSFGTNKQNSKPYSYFNCTSYRQLGKVSGVCSAHYIRYDYLYTYVLSRIQDLSRQAQVDEKELLRRILKASEQELAASAKRQSAELTRAEKRRTEVDRKFAKLYEDWSDGRITEYNFNMMSQKYQTEQQELVEKIERLSAELESEKQTTVDAETWISLIKQYANPTELTAELLNMLIEKIVIHEATTVDGMREQNIDIYYRFIGKIE